MEDDNSFWLLAKNLKKRNFEARSLHILGLSWDKFLILCSTPYLANAFVKLEVEHRIRISKLKDQNHLQMYRGHAGIFSLGNQDPCNSVIMDISKILLQFMFLATIFVLNSCWRLFDNKIDHYTSLEDCQNVFRHQFYHHLITIHVLEAVNDKVFPPGLQ